MSNLTKRALEASLKKMLLKKTLEKITIQDLTEDCGISRATFYYHFHDIYALAEWAFEENLSKALENDSADATWKDDMLRIFKAVQHNKNLVCHIYDSVNREKIARYLYRRTYEILYEMMEHQADAMQIDKESVDFIANFYKYSFVGILLEWIENGMAEDPQKLVGEMAQLLGDHMEYVLQTFANKS